MQRKCFPIEHFSARDSDKEVLTKVFLATVNMNGTKMSMEEPLGLIDDLKRFYSFNKKPINNFPFSLAMIGASYYAIQQNDSAAMNRLKAKTNRFVDRQLGRLSYKVERIDQATIGILLLNLYRWCHDEAYLKAAKALFKDIVSMQDSQGRITYSPTSKTDYVDALGMYIPFFMEYFQQTNDATAYNIATANLERYQKYGVNPQTGIPAHGYNLSTNLPVGSANWGRGIGWYLLAAAYCPQFNDSVLDKTLESLEYSQFPGCGFTSSSFDSSTALMFEIYKQSRDKTRKLKIDFIKPHITIDGYVDKCSGDTRFFNDYSHTFSESELCNGLLLMLASRFSNHLTSK